MKTDKITEYLMKLFTDFTYKEVVIMVAGMLFWLQDNAEKERDEEIFKALELLYNLSIPGEYDK